MSFYALAIYFWAAVATLGLAGPFVALAAGGCGQGIRLLAVEPPR